MKLPTPAPAEYLKTTAVVLVTLAFLQYIGGEELDLAYLAGVGLVIPVVLYLITVLSTNVEWLPQYDKMVRNER